MTWKLTQSSPTSSRFGPMFRRQTFSIASESSVRTEAPRLCYRYLLIQPATPRFLQGDSQKGRQPKLPPGDSTSRLELYAYAKLNLSRAIHKVVVRVVPNTKRSVVGQGIGRCSCSGCGRLTCGVGIRVGIDGRFVDVIREVERLAKQLYFRFLRDGKALRHPKIQNLSSVL